MINSRHKSRAIHTKFTELEQLVQSMDDIVSFKPHIVKALTGPDPPYDREVRDISDDRDRHHNFMPSSERQQGTDKEQIIELGLS